MDILESLLIPRLYPNGPPTRGERFRSLSGLFSKELLGYQCNYHIYELYLLPLLFACGFIYMRLSYSNIIRGGHGPGPIIIDRVRVEVSAHRVGLGMGFGFGPQADPCIKNNNNVEV